MKHWKFYASPVFFTLALLALIGTIGTEIDGGYVFAAVLFMFSWGSRRDYKEIVKHT